MAKSALLDRVAFFADERLSENIDVTPEGYLICRNAVIGRTGFQAYKLSEIADPEGLLEEERVGKSDESQIDLWRDPSEVFSPATIASFEGKTFTHTHPSELLSPDTERYHHAGHVQNVRKGSEPLESGDIPLLADILVTDRGAIEAIKNGDRELSCGYTYKLTKEGNKFNQTDILGNHVALVSKGRAGGEARIYDADPAAAQHPKPTFPADHVPAIRVPKGGSSCASCAFLNGSECFEPNYIAWHGSGRLEANGTLVPPDEFCSDWYVPRPGLIRDAAADGVKEKPMPTMNLLQRIKALGFQAFAKDAKPEELAEALELHTATDEKKDEKPAARSNGHRKLTRIGVLRDGTPVFDEGGNPGESAATPSPAGVGPVSSTDEPEASPERAAMDKRKRLHDMIDQLLSAGEASAEQKKAQTDTDIKELQDLMSSYLGEEAKEPEHAGDDDDDDKGKDMKAKDDDDDDDDKGKDAKGKDDDDDDDDKGKDAEIVRPEPELEASEVPENPVDKAVDRVVFDAKSTMTLLKAFRPIVAASNDKRVRAAFDTLYQGLRKAAKKGSSGKDSYARVIRASGELTEGARRSMPAGDAKDEKPRQPKESAIQKEVRETDEVYKNFMKNNRGVSATVLEKHRNK